jgi:hypothetical protein
VFGLFSVVFKCHSFSLNYFKVMNDHRVEKKLTISDNTKIIQGEKRIQLSRYEIAKCFVLPPLS